LTAFEITGWLLRLVSMLMIVGVPWYYGCATWLGQYYLFLASLLLIGIIGVHCVVGMIKKTGDLRIPWISWVCWGLSGYAFLQTLSLFSWQGETNFPPSVPMQRWALGLDRQPAAIAYSAIVQESVDSKPQELPCDLRDIPVQDQKLAWSVEPLHTQAAFYSLFLCGLLIWVGRMAFGEPTNQLWLFGTLTLIGVVIACVGIYGAVSYRAENFLGLRTGSSFATFVSKNSAGGYYNICIAGCLGMLGWTLLHTQRKTNDVRYRFPDSSWIMKIKGAFEDLLADLNTPQIASMLCLVTVVAALLISLCRGAAFSSLAALIGAVLIANAKNRSRGAWVSTVAISLATVACLVVFQVDSEAYSRLESISEFDLGEDLKTGRAYIWSVAWNAAMYYGMLGSGLGTFHFAYLPFQDPSAANWYYHAESLYAQCSVELGWIGLGVFIVSLFKLISNVQTRVPTENWKVAFPAKLAGAFLLFSQALHSFVDFAMILPALFVPACLLMGSVQGVIRHALYLPPAKRKTDRTTDSTVEVVIKANPMPQTQTFDAQVGIAMCALGVLSLYLSLGAVTSQARADALQKWTKTDNALPIPEQSSNRFATLIVLWSEQGTLSFNEASITKTPNAMRTLADAKVHDYRMRQFRKLPIRTNPIQNWQYTSPLLIQVGLASEANPVLRENLINAVGGSEALELLKTASVSYSKAHIKSPLDWRAAMGRALANVDCSRDEMSSIIASTSQLSRHSANNLLAISLMFRSLISDGDLDRLRFQTMKSNPSIATATAVARVMSSEVKDSDVSVDMFPQRPEIFESLASNVFTKDKFPRTNLAFWERARKVIESKYDPNGSVERELWLVKYAEAVGDEDAVVTHLTEAVRLESRNISLLCRLANLHVQRNELPQAVNLLERAREVNPQHPEVKRLKDRLDE
jgi:tetratricopeptide (TPR) repeat protein